MRIFAMTGTTIGFLGTFIGLVLGLVIAINAEAATVARRAGMRGNRPRPLSLS